MFCVRNIIVKKNFLLDKRFIIETTILSHLKCISKSCYSTKSDDALSLKTHYCGSLLKCDVNKTVKIRGFLHYKRADTFFVLRDIKGPVQILLQGEPEDCKVFGKIPLESYIEVEGVVAMRPDGDVNKKMQTGEIEVVTNKLNVISESTNLPFQLSDRLKPVNRYLRETYRYLELRHFDIKNNLVLRSQVSKKIRDYLHNRDFLDITTPTLTIHTPGGASSFNVSSERGANFCLAQSPQLYKQLLMIGGLDKYYQFAVCYRNEGIQAERQFEFMQLDLEMADTTVNGVMDLMEKIIANSWPDDYPRIPSQFTRMTYADAMDTYGSDKPDTRFDWRITDVTSEVSESGVSMWTSSLDVESCCAKAFVVPQNNHLLKKPELIKFETFAQNLFGTGGVTVLLVQPELKLKSKVTKYFSNNFASKLISKCDAKPGDAIFLSTGPRYNVNTTLGRLRIIVANYLEDCSVAVREPNAYHFLWVMDFPLFERENGELVACHHAFTAPMEVDMPLLRTNPEQVRSQHYDLVLNGCEIAGGSIRIHDPTLQKYILKDILKFDANVFEPFLNAFKYGAPPHGGIALGFDRYISCISNSKSVRDVIAFPKSGSGRCILSKSEQTT